MAEWNESKMTIDGTELTTGQVMTLRVAMEAYHSELETNGLGNDKQGRAICDGYKKCIKQLRELMGYG